MPSTHLVNKVSIEHNVVRVGDSSYAVSDIRGVEVLHAERHYYLFLSLLPFPAYLLFNASLISALLFCGIFIWGWVKCPSWKIKLFTSSGPQILTEFGYSRFNKKSALSAAENAKKVASLISDKLV